MISEKKLLNYLNWLIENQKYNAEERERANFDSRVNRECERVALMLKEMILEKQFEEE